MSSGCGWCGSISCRSRRLRPRSSKRAAPSSLPEPATLVPKTPTRSRPNVLSALGGAAAAPGSRPSHPLRAAPRRHRHLRPQALRHHSLRRAYRQTFLGSLDAGLLRPDQDTGEPAGGNVVTMVGGWQRIWAFFARHGLLDPVRAAELSTDEALETHTLLPQTRRIRSLTLKPAQVDQLRAAGPRRRGRCPRRADRWAAAAVRRPGTLRPASSP